MIGGAVAIVVVAVVAFALLSDRSDDPAAATTVTTTLDAPTPTSEPLDRTGSSALVQALPGSVRQFVLTSVEPADTLDGSLEAWTAGYSGEALAADGTPVGALTPPQAETVEGETTADPAAAAPSTPGDGSASVTPPTLTVTVGQWDDAGGATAGAQALAGDLGDPTSTEEVTVGDEVTGSLSFYAGDDEATGTAVWTNGTVAIRAVGPASEIANFATAFGL